MTLKAEKRARRAAEQAGKAVARMGAVTLAELNPRFVGAGGDGITDSATGESVPRREGVGLSFDCPCGCGRRGFVYFENPLDGGPSCAGGAPTWKRVGDTFETLTLTPSIQRADPDGCRWHGYITNGEAKSV